MQLQPLQQPQQPLMGMPGSGPLPPQRQHQEHTPGGMAPLALQPQQQHPVASLASQQQQPPGGMAPLALQPQQQHPVASLASQQQQPPGGMASLALQQQQQRPPGGMASLAHQPSLLHTSTILPSTSFPLQLPHLAAVQLPPHQIPPVHPALLAAMAATSAVLPVASVQTLPSAAVAAAGTGAAAAAAGGAGPLGVTVSPRADSSLGPPVQTGLEWWWRQQAMTTVQWLHPGEDCLMLRLYSDVHQVCQYAICRNNHPIKQLHKMDRTGTAVYSLRADGSLDVQQQLKEYLPSVLSDKKMKHWKSHCDVMAVSGAWLNPIVSMHQWCKQQQQQQEQQ